MANSRSYLSDEHEDFTVSHRKTILSILEALIRRRVTLSGAFNSGSEVLLTAIIDYDADDDVIYLDVNSNAERNDEFLRSERVIFFGFFDGIKVQWTSTGVRSVDFERQKAFAIEIPKKLQRIQRRGSFRIATPVHNPVLCRIRLKPDHEIVMPLVDICAEGVGVTLPDPPDPAVEKNAVFQTCRIEHPDLGVIEVPVVVQSLWEVTLKNGTKSQRAGIEFINIGATRQALIQRYIYKLEREKLTNASDRI